MLTQWGRSLDPNNILSEYPRPQMRRSRYLMLNGYWDCTVTRSAKLPSDFPKKILVPFSPECALAGFSHDLKPEEYLWYRRVITVPEDWAENVLLHFDAVDQQADVFLNGEHAASHAGGYLPFSCMLPKTGEVEIVVRVRDMTDTSYHSRGKQKTDRGGIWYTPQSGIWQSVWMEPVPAEYVSALKITPLFDAREVEITVESTVDRRACAIRYNGNTFTGMTNEPITVPAREASLWTPETPDLHNFTVILGRDEVQSYFAMRKCVVTPDADGVLRIMLNNEPYFQTGLLDQGYWPDGLYTAPSDKAMIYDIQTAKKMGFNLLRKHIKVEPLRWYYHCDRLGMLVWQDMPNGGGKYSWPIVTGPLFTSIHISDRFYRLFARKSGEGRNQYRVELQEMIRHLYNCPCIVMWVPFNEGWGQFDAKKTLEFVETLDETRMVDHASGWHDQYCGDFKSIHIYFRPYKHRPDKFGRCVILSEFGGYSCAVEGHTNFNKQEFGYKKESDLSSLADSFRKLYETEIYPAADRELCATIYTQLTDVEDEVNGLITYDRAKVKLPVKLTNEINGHLKGIVRNMPTRE